MIFFIIGFFCSAAQELPGEELWTAPQQLQPTTVFKSEPTQSANPSTDLQSNQTKNASKKKTATFQDKSLSNLPREYFVSSQRQSTSSELIQPPKGSIEIFRGLKVGDILEVNIPHSVIAFPDEKAPVIGIVSQGSLSGFKFIGESYLEKNSKRIFIDFSRLVSGQQIFNLRGVGVSSEGQPGLNGEYHSREVEYFTGDFIASFAAGYFDGLVPRRSNAFGQIEIDSSVDSAVKKGLASGALSTAERFREKLKRVPEFSEIKGPFNLKILTLEQAKTLN